MPIKAAHGDLYAVADKEYNPLNFNLLPYCLHGAGVKRSDDGAEPEKTG